MAKKHDINGCSFWYIGRL